MKLQESSFDLHIYPNPRGWAIYDERRQRISGIFNNPNDAVIVARKLMRNLKVQITVHGKHEKDQQKRKRKIRNKQRNEKIKTNSNTDKNIFSL